MKRALALLVLLAAPVVGREPSLYSQTPSKPLAAAPQVVKVKAEVGAQAVLKSGATGEVTWVWDRRALPEKRVYEDTAKKALVLTSAANAEFSITCVEFQAGKGYLQTEYLVTFEGGGPDPPPPPPPVDSLTARLKAAYQADLTAGKAKVAEFRQAGVLFSQAGQFLDLVTSTGDAYRALDLAVSRTITAGDLPASQAVIFAELEKVAPRAKDQPVTEVLKTALRRTFMEIARAVEAVLGPQPPPTPGARTVLLVRETAASTPELARAIAALRAGPQAAYLKSKGHVLTILDDDAVGPDGQPAPLLVKYRPHYQNLKLPALVIADGATVLSAVSLADTATADQILEAIKKAGG